MASRALAVAVLPLFSLLLLDLLGRPCLAQNAIFACDVGTNPSLGSLGFCDTSTPLADRVADLVGRLTLSEKIQFLVSKSPAVPRLGLPAYEWWSEALHGVSYVWPGTRFSPLVPGATSFPQVILTAASFNATLFEAIGKVVSTEARAMYNVGFAGLTYSSLHVNIFRDPRWGRGQETPGEDPLLASKYAVAYVRGLEQAEDPNSLKVAACCKHYTAYDVDNWKGVRRYTFNAKVTQQDLDDTYQVPFKSCVVDANVARVMCSYNQVNGVPTCHDPDLLSGVIRGQWKLNGYIVSDCDSVDVLYNSQHYTKTPEEATAKSILAGLDLNCGAFNVKHAGAAIAAVLLKESDIDKAISNNIATLMRLGFYDGNPSRPYGSLGPSDVCTQAHQDLALDAARQGIVLLKNSNSMLPFSASSVSSLAVIGPNSNVTKTMIGNYEGTPCSYVTPLQGLAALVPKVVSYQCCTSAACPNETMRFILAKQAASRADGTILVMGTDQSIEREDLDRTDLLLPGGQATVVTEIAKVAKGAVLLVLMSGGPLDVTFAKNDNISAILWVGFPGEKGGTAIADVIFGKYNPSGRLPVTWYPQSFAQNVPMSDMNMRPNPATGYPGRTYRFYNGEVVYAFGDGLGYTNFEHRLLHAPKLVSIPLEEGHPCRCRRCNSVEVVEDGCRSLAFDVHLQVRNAGSVDGIETVFLYSTPPAVHNAPGKHLVGFKKVAVKAGHAAKVVFKVDVCKQLHVVDENGRKKMGLGAHVLHVGSIKHTLDVRV